MLLMDIFEARDPKKTYHISEVKGKLDKITVKLEGSESASWTKLGKRYKEINDALKKLQDERDEMNEKVKKDMLDNYFDAEDAVMTRIVETVSITAQIGKTPTPSPKVDNDKVVLELLKLMPELKEKIELLQKECSSMPAVKSPSLSIKTEGVGDVWDKFKSKLGKFLEGIMSWGTKYDAKLANIKQMLKPQRQVKEATIAHYDAKHQERMDSGKAMKAKTLVKNLKDSSIPQADVDALIKAMTHSGIDGDMIVDAKELKKIAAAAKVDYDDALASAGLLEDFVSEGKENNPPKRPAKPKEGTKIGTHLVSSKDVSKNVHAGDWVKITGGDHKDHYGYITGSIKLKGEDGEVIMTGPLNKRLKFKVDISDTKTPEIVEVAFDDVKMETKYHDNEHFGKVAEKAKSKVEKQTAKVSNIQDLHYFTAPDGERYALAPAGTAPNLRWSPASTEPVAAMVVNAKKERTAEDKKKSKDYLKGIAAAVTAYEAAIAERMDRFTKTDAKAVEQSLKNTKAVYAAMVKYDTVVNDFNALSKKLNKAWDDQDDKTFAEGTQALASLFYSVREDSKISKSKLSLPKFITPGRTIAAQGYDYIMWARDNAEKNLKRMRMSDKQKAAADKASVRMQMRWFE